MFHKIYDNKIFRSGFTILEVMLSMVLFICALTIFMRYNKNISANKSKSYVKNIAAALAQERIEFIKGTKINDIFTHSGTEAIVRTKDSIQFDRITRIDTTGGSPNMVIITSVVYWKRRTDSLSLQTLRAWE